MIIIGITGGTGTGKTTVLRLFESRGTYAVDADAIYHRLLAESPEMLAAIEEQFPGAVTDGALDTKKLGVRVFGSPEALRILGRITHRFVIDDIQKKLDIARRVGYRSMAIDAVALFESGCDQICDVTVGVIALPSVRAARIRVRDGLTEEYARSRIEAQKPDAYYRELCDHILENNGDIAAFEAGALDLINIIMNGACK